MKQSNIICFGEMLWDILPTEKQAGGAPMNVAVHLKNLGLNPYIISRVGEDDLGNELFDFVEKKELDTSLIQRGKTHLTGVAKANVSDQNEVTYKILQPVAWDYIQFDEEAIEKVKNSDAFVFGSLAARSAFTRETLFKFLEIAPFKVFDVNLREPFYSKELIEKLLFSANMVKMNAHELALITAWNGEMMEEKDAIIELASRFDIDIICVTRGENGAILFKNRQFFESNGFSVKVKDTIGSGDSFLAALLKNILENNDPSKSLTFACALGSLVATYQGATPRVSEKEIQAFLEKV